MPENHTTIIAWTICGVGRVDEAAGAFASAIAANIDEHIIIDTAPDGTPPILVDVPGLVRVVRWPWQNDFAAARNAALTFAAETGAGWGLMLDTDERVICPDPAALRSFLDALPESVRVVVAYESDGATVRERLFRLPARSRFVGRTHEAFPVAPGEQAMVPPEIVTWGSLPKTAEQLRAKNERDAVMLAAEIEADPDSARWRFYLGAALAGLGRHGEAIDAYRAATDRDTGEIGALSCVRAAEILVAEKRYEESVAACARGMTMRADLPELPWIAAGASWNMGDVYQAEAFARIAKVHGDQGPGRNAARERWTGFRVARARNEGPDEILALVDRARGRVREPLTPDPNPIRITVTSTGFRAAEWAPRCIASVASQNRVAHHVYVAADHETLHAADRALRLGARGGIGRGLLANLLPIWRSLPDDDVIVWLDGDDWLAHDRALDVVAKAHAAGALVTYGQFITSDGTIGFCAQGDSDPRSGPWVYSHLKSFRAGLVQRIRDEDLRRADGEYLDLAIDQAIMIPCVEMAAERAVFIPRVLAVYNVEHSFHANANDAERTREGAEVARIRRMPRYARVEWPVPVK
jgi:tetratricopeptide (TPR) repeat protein